MYHATVSETGIQNVFIDSDSQVVNRVFHKAGIPVTIGGSQSGVPRKDSLPGNRKPGLIILRMADQTICIVASSKLRGCGRKKSGKPRRNF
jgi:hypothetical protein